MSSHRLRWMSLGRPNWARPPSADTNLPAWKSALAFGRRRPITWSPHAWTSSSRLGKGADASGTDGAEASDGWATGSEAAGASSGRRRRRARAPPARARPTPVGVARPPEGRRRPGCPPVSTGDAGRRGSGGRRSGRGRRVAPPERRGATRAAGAGRPVGTAAARAASAAPVLDVGAAGVGAGAGAGAPAPPASWSATGAARGLESLDAGQQGGRRVVGLGMDEPDQRHLQVDPGVGRVAHRDLGPTEVLHGPDQCGQSDASGLGGQGVARSAPDTVTRSGATRARKPCRRWSTRSTVSCWGLNPEAVRPATATSARSTSRSASASTTSSSSGRSSSTASEAATWSRMERASRAEPRPRRTARSRASSPTSRWASSRTWARSSDRVSGPSRRNS